MKKLFSLIAIACGVLLLTGCGGGSKTYTCTETQSNGEEKIISKLVATLDDDNKIKGYDIIVECDNSETAEMFHNLYSGSTISGNTVTIKNAHETDAYKALGLTGITKEELKEKLSSISNDPSKLSCE